MLTKQVNEREKHANKIRANMVIYTCDFHWERVSEAGTRGEVVELHPNVRHN